MGSVKRVQWMGFNQRGAGCWLVGRPEGGGGTVFLEPMDDTQTCRLGTPEF